jgi:hypothetical protein
MKIKLIINEQHSLLPDQKRALDEFIEMKDEAITVDTIKVPASGWTLQEMNAVQDELWQEFFDGEEDISVIFVSPVPYLLKELASYNEYSGFCIYVLHNDHREKKELPNGKVIMTIAKEGWVIV